MKRQSHEFSPLTLEHGPETSVACPETSWVSVFQCFSVSVFQCFSVSVFQCFSVSVFQCFSVSVPAPITRGFSACPETSWVKLLC